MLQTIGIFLIFLTPLIFFHELGHFLFARLFGVRVEVFSIGFGPKIFKRKWGDTQYALSIIPLGGYIKMFGDDPLKANDISQEDKKHAFTFKSKWARFWIVFGGPLANFILAYVLFFGLLLSGEKVFEAKLGLIPEKSTFKEIGFQTGDSIVKVNGDTVFGLPDLTLKTEGHHVDTVEVARRQGVVKLNVDLPGRDFNKELINHSTPLRYPVVVNKNGDKFLLAIDGDLKSSKMALDEFAILPPSTQLALYKVEGSFDAGSYESYFVEEKKSLLPLSNGKKLYDHLYESGFVAMDLLIDRLNVDSPAEVAGIKPNDVIWSINNEPLFDFVGLREKVQGAESNTKINIQIYRQGTEFNFEVLPDEKVVGEIAYKTIGIYSSAQYFPRKFITSQSKGFFESIPLAFVRTWSSIEMTIHHFQRLFSRQASFDEIGGPLMIGKVASDSFKISFTYFLGLMALVSINLGIINLFPIPVLDGGHIFFIFLEIINRGPLSRRKMEIAQQFGLSILLLLMIAAIYNDVARFMR